jgi:acyl-coenzyme A thioesterase PaaI-like protein
LKALPRHDPHCVGCGDENPASLGIAFSTDGERVFGAVRLDARHQGAPGFAHGGMVATALDDLLGTLLMLLKRPAVTARLEIDYRRPAMIGVDFTMEAWVEEVDGRKLHLRGVLRDADAQVIAEARALFLEISAEHWRGNGGDVPEAMRGLPY